MCRRRGQARLARLAEKYGANITMDGVLLNVAWSYPLPRPGTGHAKPQKYGTRCRIFLPDIKHGGPPPDMPSAPLRQMKPDAAE